jgi:dihydrofolate reductase
MSWTGPADKRLFRSLTSVGGGVCLAGSTTFDLISGKGLRGRELIRLSRNGYTMEAIRHKYPDAWLLGGPTIARVAYDRKFLTEVHLHMIGVNLFAGIRMLDIFPKYFGTPALVVEYPDDNLRHVVYRL